MPEHGAMTKPFAMLICGYLLRNAEIPMVSRRDEYDMLGKTLDKEKFKRYLQAFGIKKMESWAAKCLH